MQKKKYVPIFAVAAAFVILLAAGAAAFIKSHRAAHARTAVPVAAAEPDGAEEWMYLQRANADGSIPDEAVNAAIAQSKAAGKASKGSPRTDQVWTELGPRNIGGRVRDAAADPATQDVVYVATGSGGLWRSSDGGATLTSAWDNYLPQSMGAVAVDSQGVVWAGTGEPDHGGGSAYYGKGISSPPTTARLGPLWPRGRRHDRPDRHRPARRRPRVRRRPGCAARHRAVSRALHDRGRWGDVDSRDRAGEQLHGRDRPEHRQGEPRHHARDDVGQDP